MQTRRSALLVFLVPAACTRARKPLEELLPEQVAGGWTRSSVAVLPSEESPALIRSLGLKRAVRATYRGAGTVRVRVFEMNVEASAFELIQKWRQQDGLAMYRGPFFFAAQSSDAAPDAVSAFLRSLQGALNPA